MAVAQDGITISLFNILTIRVSEGAWQSFLDYAANHPFQFLLMVLFFMFFLYSIIQARWEVKWIRNAQLEKFMKLFRPEKEHDSQNEENRN